MKATEINIEKIMARTLGRKLHSYETWNGSATTIVVEHVEKLYDGVSFSGTNCWGGKSEIYVDMDFVKPLVRNGEAVKHNEIERCDVRTEWSFR